MGWKEVGSGLERGRGWVGSQGRAGQGRAGQGRAGRAGQGRAGQSRAEQGAGQGRRFPRHACTSISALGLVCLVKVLGFRVCG